MFNSLKSALISLCPLDQLLLFYNTPGSMDNGYSDQNNLFV